MLSLQNTWKRSTLKTITRRAYLVCSSEEHLEVKLSKIRVSFQNINGYPHWVINQIFNEIQKEQTPKEVIPTATTTDDNPIQLIIPYGGLEGE